MYCSNNSEIYDVEQLIKVMELQKFAHFIASFH